MNALNQILSLLGVTWPELRLLLIWGAITGILNLIVGRRPQINEWCKRYPRWAAWCKLWQAIGLNPWTVVDAVRVFASGRFEDAHKGKLAACIRYLSKTTLIGLLLVGCSATMEETRLENISNIRALGIPVAASTARDSARCSTLSEREYWFGGIAQGTAVASGATGLASIPIKSERGETYAAIGAASLAATTAALSYFSSQAAKSWISEGCSNE